MKQMELFDANARAEEIKTFFNQLLAHDWYYDYSDDYSVFLKGVASHKAIVRKCEKDDLLRQMFADFSNYYAKKRDKPEIEEYLDSVNK